VDPRRPWLLRLPLRSVLPALPSPRCERSALSRRLLLVRISYKLVVERADERVEQYHAARTSLADVAAADIPQAAIGNNGGGFILRPLLANPLNCFDTIEHL
jgi:hypothetical protein